MEEQPLEYMNINQLYGWEKPHECSYCHKNQNTTWSFTKQKMLPYTYQLMMERGWRRCGDYYYKCNLATACCKQWTIRQDVTQFKIKKDQKKTIKKMMQVAYQCATMKIEPKQMPTTKNNQSCPKGKIIVQIKQQSKLLMLNTCKKINEQIHAYLTSKIIQKEKLNLDILDKLKYFSSNESARGDYYCNYVMLLYGVNKKCFLKEYSLHNFVGEMKTVIEAIGSCQDFKVQVQKGGYLIFILNEKLKKQISNQFQVIEIQQENKMKIPINEHTGLKKQKKRNSSCQFIKPVYQGQIKITSNQITFGKIKIDIVPVDQADQSWRLYRKYCENIHQKKQKSMSSYVNFLCLPGLSTDIKYGQSQKMYIPSWDPKEQYQKGTPAGSGNKKLMGCFHMKYYLESKLIAVGVVDIVPAGLSSVYFFYDPEYKEYRLGVFSSLIEIEYIRFQNLSFPEFKNYYMGFYIQNNQKMSYKCDYEPCQLLCPVTYTFVEFTSQLKEYINKIISKQVKSVRLAKEGVQINPDLKFDKDIGVYINNQLKLRYKSKKLKLSEINPQFFIPVLNILKNYIQVWGRQIFNILTFTL